MAKFTEGNKFGEGRPKGAVNKTTAAAREALASAIAGEMETVLEKLQSIKDPVKYIDALSKILPYVMPRLNTIGLNGDDEEKIIVVKYEDE